MTRFMNVSCLLAVLGCFALPAISRADDAQPPTPTIFSANGLEGLTSAGILIETLDGEGARRTGLTKEALDTALRAALLASRTAAVQEKPGDAYFYLSVSLVPLENSQSTVYNISLQVKQQAMLFRPDGSIVKVFGAATWDEEAEGGVAPDGQVQQAVKDAIRNMVDKFTVDWHKANDPAQ